jgi:hypothetical protein
MKTPYEYKESFITTTKEKSDNRVSMFYIVERLSELSEIESDKKLREQIDEFRNECIYNLGVNALHNHNN